MDRNVGGIDRRIRMAAGVLILLLGTIYGGWWGWLGLLLLVSALARRAPLYLAFGFSSYHPQDLSEPEPSEEQAED